MVTPPASPLPPPGSTSVPPEEQRATAARSRGAAESALVKQHAPLRNPRLHWHIFMITIWLFILWVLLVAGTATEHVRINGGNGSCLKYGLFKVWSCRSDWAVDLADWQVSDHCQGYRVHLQAAGAFAILSILSVSAALMIAIFQDLLLLCNIFSLLTGIIVAIAWVFMLFTWALVAGFFNRALCTDDSTYTIAKQEEAQYTHGFILFLISWLLTTLCLCLWWLKHLKVLPF